MNNKPATREELEALRREWLRSFVPSETAIDGGLFPSRIGDGMLGYDYNDFELAGEPALPSEPHPDADKPLPGRRPARRR
jgi:hypothetical protein